MLSRAADSLYWMSRYLERAEHTARLVDVYLNLSLEQSHLLPPGQRWEALLNILHVDLPESGLRDDFHAPRLLTFDQRNASSIVACIATARENARQVRERISSEMWLQLNSLYLKVRSTDSDWLWSAQPHLFFQEVKDGAHLFQGITDSTMTHDEGWHFIQLGRFIERASNAATLLDRHLYTFAVPPDNRIISDEYFEWLGLLKCLTAFEAYCKVYHADLRANRIIEFLLYNPYFPHAIRFCLEMVQTALQGIAETTTISRNSRVHRLAGRLRSALSFDQVDEILADDIHTYLRGIQRQCMQIHDAIYETYITYPVDVALT